MALLERDDRSEGQIRYSSFLESVPVDAWSNHQFQFFKFLIRAMAKQSWLTKCVDHGAL